VLAKYVLISSNRSNYAIAIHYRFPALLTLPVRNVEAMSYIPFNKWGGGGGEIFPLKFGRDPEKFWGEGPHLKNFKKG